jgi:hypothetical protein
LVAGPMSKRIRAKPGSAISISDSNSLLISAWR